MCFDNPLHATSGYKHTLHRIFNPPFAHAYNPPSRIDMILSITRNGGNLVSISQQEILQIYYYVHLTSYVTCFAKTHHLRTPCQEHHSPPMVSSINKLTNIASTPLPNADKSAFAEACF